MSEDRAQRLRLLVETSAGTPMGVLLRSFWQPIAIASTLNRGNAKPIRALSEDLTLYRGEGGKFHLIGARCAHRGTVLHTGSIEGDSLRCMYHGWRYDGNGRVVEMPAERGGISHEVVATVGYPCFEYAGLVFAYLGPQPAPAFDLPRKTFLEDSARHLFPFEETWDCHWFQQIENSLDAAHVSFAHMWGRSNRFGERITSVVPTLAYEETCAGLRQIATRSPDNVRISDWTFPNNNHVLVPGPKRDDPWSHLCVWAVPIDETATMRFTVLSSEPGCDWFERDHDPAFQPAAHREALFSGGQLPELRTIQALNVQDYVAVRGQGVIADRAAEYLGHSDAGIAKLRQLFWRELGAIQECRATKAWQRLPEVPTMPTPA